MFRTSDATYGTSVKTPQPLPYWKVVVSQHHLGRATQDLLASLQPQEHLEVGGCGSKFLAVLTGQASDYFACEPGTCKWDSCAPEALLTELGGYCSNIKGEALTYRYEDRALRNEGIIATLDRSHFDRLVAEARPRL